MTQEQREAAIYDSKRVSKDLVAETYRYYLREYEAALTACEKERDALRRNYNISTDRNMAHMSIRKRLDEQLTQSEAEVSRLRVALEDIESHITACAVRYGVKMQRYINGIYIRETARKALAPATAARTAKLAESIRASELQWVQGRADDKEPIDFVGRDVNAPATAAAEAKP